MGYWPLRINHRIWEASTMGYFHGIFRGNITNVSNGDGCDFRRVPLKTGLKRRPRFWWPPKKRLGQAFLILFSGDLPCHGMIRSGDIAWHDQQAHLVDQLQAELRQCDCEECMVGRPRRWALFGRGCLGSTWWFNHSKWCEKTMNNGRFTLW